MENIAEKFDTSYNATNVIEEMCTKLGISSHVDDETFMEPIRERVSKAKNEYRNQTRFSEEDRLSHEGAHQIATCLGHSEKSNSRKKANNLSAIVCMVRDKIMKCELELKMNKNSRIKKKNITKIQDLRRNRIHFLDMKMKELLKSTHDSPIFESDLEFGRSDSLNAGDFVPFIHSPNYTLPSYCFQILPPEMYSHYLQDVMDLPDIELQHIPPSF